MDGAVPLFRMEGISKRYGGVRALEKADLTVSAGSIHAILGENGAGKSTLIKIMAGVVAPDEGSMKLDGRVVNFASPAAANQAGIVCIFQELSLIPELSVADNIVISDPPKRFGMIDRKAQRRIAQEALARAGASDIHPRALVKDLPLSRRQMVEIAKALARKPRILILDEATSTLDVATRDRLFRVIRRLRAAGTGILFISHRMEEVEEIADRVTIVRSGEDVATLQRGEADARRMVELMTGTKEARQELRQAPDAPTRVRDEVVMRVSGVRLHRQAAPIQAEIRAGELLGVAGLEGHGQDHFLRVLAGVPPVGGEVACLTGSQAKTLRSPADALASGVAYVPKDRRGEGIFETRSILENFQVATLETDRRLGLLRRSMTERRFDHYAELMRIRTGHRSNAITSLSGGTQQKVLIARWLATDPRVLLLNDPTRGVDMGTKSDIYEVLTGAASRGVAVVMLSTEVIELVELMDRVLVFREGELHRELHRGEFSHARLVASYFGRDAE
jgi:ribose transport system ATP-binding protein